MNFEPSLSPRFVAYIRDYLLDRNIDPDPIFAESGIESSMYQEHDSALPVHQVATLFELAAKYSNNPCMGLSMAQGYHYETSSLLIIAMLAAPSVEDGLKFLKRFDPYVDSGLEIELNFNTPLAEFGARLIISDEVNGNQINEYLMTFLMQSISNATRKRPPIRHVWFNHACDQNRKVLEEFFDAPVTFSQPLNKFYFDRSFLQERFFTSNGLLFDVLNNAMKTYFSAVNEQNGFVDLVCREITRCDSEDVINVELIAGRLTISPRTLRRRLADEGYSFQEAKNLARCNRAKYFLSHTRMPLSEIAFELGFSELSAFSRAFRSWVGEPPQSYRENYRSFARG